MSNVMEWKKQRRKACSVRGCPTEPNEPNIRFFHFPQNEERFEKWLEFCDHNFLKVRGAPQCSHLYVCSRHFAREAFQNELLNRLNQNAFPTLLPAPARARYSSPPPGLPTTPPPYSPSPPPEDALTLPEGPAPLPFPTPLGQMFSTFCPSKQQSVPSSTSVTNVNIIKHKLPWNILAPSPTIDDDVPNDEKVFQIASTLKVCRNALPKECDADDIDVLLMILSDWENLDVSRRKYYFNKALKLYNAICQGKYSSHTSEGMYKLGGSQEWVVSSTREVSDTVEDSKSLPPGSSDSSKEVTVVCIAFM